MNILRHEYISSVEGRTSLGWNPSNGIIRLKYITVFWLSIVVCLLLSKMLLFSCSIYLALFRHHFTIPTPAWDLVKRDIKHPRDLELQ